MGAAHSTARGEPSQGRMHFSAMPSLWYSLRPSISFSSGWLMLRSASSRRPEPLTVRMRSRSATSAVSAKLLLSTSVYWAATAFISPMGEYFLKITSPSPVVKISSGSPRRMRWVRRISLGITTRPSSSMRRTIPVAFMFLLLRFLKNACSTSICQAGPFIPAAPAQKDLHGKLPLRCVSGRVLLQ